MSGTQQNNLSTNKTNEDDGFREMFARVNRNQEMMEIYLRMDVLARVKQLTDQNSDLLQRMGRMEQQHSSELEKLKKSMKKMIDTNATLKTENSEIRFRLAQIERGQKKMQQTSANQLEDLQKKIDARFDKTKEEHNEKKADATADTVIDQVQQQLKPVSNKLDELQNFIGDKLHDYVVVSCYDEFPDFLSYRVFHLNHHKESLKDLEFNNTFYKKDLLLLSNWAFLCPEGEDLEYKNVLSICREWKKQRPDGKIHCLYDYAKDENYKKPSKKLQKLFDTCESYQEHDKDNTITDIAAINKYWPEFAHDILHSNQSD